MCIRDVVELCSKFLLGDQTSRSPQYQRYLQMLKQGQTEAHARKLERMLAPERTVAPASKVWQRPARKVWQARAAK